MKTENSFSLGTILATTTKFKYTNEGESVSGTVEISSAVPLLKRDFFSCKGSTFPSLERLVNALKYGEVDGILVDLYTAHYRNDLFNVTWIVVSQIIPFEFTSGVVISGNAAKLEQHFRDYIGNKSTVVVTEVLQKTNQDNNKVGKPCPLCVSEKNWIFCC